MGKRLIIVTHPPKLPNAKAEEAKILAGLPKPKPTFCIDKKPI